jgi:hypothetical protein
MASQNTGLLTLTNPRKSTRHLAPDEMPNPKLQVANLLCNNKTRTDASATADNSIIVQGMMEKNASFQPTKKKLEKDIWI